MALAGGRLSAALGSFSPFEPVRRRCGGGVWSLGGVRAVGDKGACRRGWAGWVSSLATRPSESPLELPLAEAPLDRSALAEARLDEASSLAEARIGEASLAEP